MKFSAIIAFVLTFVLAVSVTTVSAGISSKTCMVCAQRHAMLASPTCDFSTVQTTFTSNSSLTPVQRDCYCPLAASDAWIQSCIEPGGCVANDTAQVYGAMSVLKDSQACAGAAAPVPVAPTPAQPSTGVTSGSGNPSNPANPTNDAGALIGSVSPKVLAGTAFAVASIFVFLL
ncbi:hypothetical protein BGZ96_011873 [Linnemannia gamsii]|uniref:Uncharacterized protein n=1 Tax=Linnemannia gamsii TaxID=64522 RepID=A0ABQ7JT24_9FUNG|nr:hypothetical protein BGZ96_011873 [Linnemannia gamsii]